MARSNRSSIHDKVVWLTGSASGLGLHLTECFVRRGYNVVATDIAIDQLMKVAKERMWPQAQLSLHKLDVRNGDDWREIRDHTLSRWGGIDYLLNIAGVIQPGYLYDVSESDIDIHLDINVKGVMLGCQVVSEHMLQRGSGHIINIASTAGLAAVPGIGLYSASKFAVRAYTLALAEELRPYQVDVTVICPDAIETPMLDKQLDFDEAAMTFSGGKTLTVEDLERAIFSQVIKKKPLELCLPLDRSTMAKAANIFPGVTQYLSAQLRKKGLGELKRRRETSG
ncbi:MAG: SDR family oxidoreductase [Pseudomonadales bacterium]|nr:SDR family oxidoreductase [Pseudomonadales bacterium]